MISLSKSGNTVTFAFDDNSGYLQNGTIDVPVNSLSLVIDSSDMVTFKKSASNDIFVSALVSDFGMSKSELEAWYKENMVGSTGGGGGGTVDQTIISGSTNAVAGGAVYDAVMVVFDGDVEYQTTGYTRYYPAQNEPASYENAAKYVKITGVNPSGTRDYFGNVQLINEQGQTVSGTITSYWSNITVPSSLIDYIIYTYNQLNWNTLTLETIDGWKISYIDSIVDDDGSINNNTIYIGEKSYSSVTASEAIENVIDSKQDKLSAGTSININNSNVISVAIDTYLNSGSTNPVQNSVVTNALGNKVDNGTFDIRTLSSSTITCQSDYGDSAKTGFSSATYFDAAKSVTTMQASYGDTVADFFTIKIAYSQWDIDNDNEQEYEIYRISNSSEFVNSASSFVNATAVYQGYPVYSYNISISPASSNGKITSVYAYRMTRTAEVVDGQIVYGEWEPATYTYNLYINQQKEVLEIINYILGQLNQ